MFRQLFIWIPVLLVGIVAATTLFLYSHSYVSFIHFILDSIHRSDLEEIIRSRYFPETKFQLLKLTSLSVSVLSFLFGVFVCIWRKQYFLAVERLRTSFVFYFYKTRDLFLSFDRNGRIATGILLLIILIRSIYYASSFYIQYDEAWNYNLFLDKHISYSLGAYNNYPLHNIVSWFFVKLFGNSVFVLRVPSILVGVGTVFFVTLLAKKLSGKQWIALSVAAVFACMPVSIFYMMYARGVMFELFFCVLITGLLLYYIRHGFTFRRIVFIAVLQALGTYSMLSHPYFIVASALALILYSLLHSGKQMVYFLLHGILSIVFSLLLLTPMIVGTGIAPGISHATSLDTIEFSSILTHIETYSYFITGFNFMFYMQFVTCVVLLFFFRKISIALFSILFSLVLFSMLIIIPITTKIFPPERALSFLVLIPMLTLPLLFSLFAKHAHFNIILSAVTVCMIIVFSYKSHTHHFLNWSKKLDHLVFETADMFKKEKIAVAYNDCPDFSYFIPGIEFYLKQDHKQIVFVSSSPASTRYASVMDSSINYIISCEKSLPETMEIIYEANGFVLCKRKGIN